MGSLKKSSEEKEKLIQQIKAGNPEKTEVKNSDESSEEDVERELSEWEKRLEGIS
jgi:hypothetical protein